MYNTDTIAAISTALSDSGIGMIRVSGDDAIEMVNNIFISPSGKHILTTVPSHTVHYGYMLDADNEVLDEVMVTVLKAPKSFTTEDTVEISCHGGVTVLQAILKSVLHTGARMAEPGEFTKRAFLNGRIDLTKAEAVMDIIHSQNEYALKSSVNQLTGKLAEKIKELRAQIIYEIAFIESAIDDPEHISLDGYSDTLSEKVEILKKEIQILLDTFEDGRRMKEGIQTVILGRPNAGKSSLINSLSGTQKAIVTDIEGTTRDILEETINIKGITLLLADTAGIRETEDVIEKIGVERAKESAKDADLILYVVDASKALDESDFEIISLLKSKKSIVLLNKSDLDTVLSKEMLSDILLENGISLDSFAVISTSMATMDGLEEVKKQIEKNFFSGKISSHSEIILTNLRHKEAMDQAVHALSCVEQSLRDDMPEDFYSIDLMSAYTSLGSIIGEEVDDDLVNTIFSKFCMGK